MIDRVSIESQRERVMEAMVNAVPLKQFSEPDDIARAVEYLASAGNVTGQSMNIDGGLEFD